jgi:hypothetical protein
MSEHIIHLLESIKVDEQDGSTAVIASGKRQGEINVLGEQGTVGQPREYVVGGPH